VKAKTLQKDSFDFIPDICCGDPTFNHEILEQVIILAIEIAREGREGKKIGTLFTVCDAEKVLRNSRCLILDPLQHHDERLKHISDPNLRETIKELALLDGAFVVNCQGVVLSACRYLEVTIGDISLPLGLGSRHMAAASMSKHTDCVAIVVSASSIVRIFVNGEIVSEIIPELWLLKRYSVHLDGPYSKRTLEEVTVLEKEAS